MFIHPYLKQYYSQQPNMETSHVIYKMINKMWPIHRVEYTSALKMKEILIQPQHE